MHVTFIVSLFPTGSLAFAESQFGFHPNIWRAEFKFWDNPDSKQVKYVYVEQVWLELEELQTDKIWFFSLLG